MIRGPWNLPVTYAAKISVKRVFRGDRDRFKSGTVILEGLGNPKICVSRPKIGDTRIFFADPIELEEFNFPAENRTHFRLRSSILRLTLENLRFLWNDEKLRASNQSLNSGRNKLKLLFRNKFKLLLQWFRTRDLRLTALPLNVAAALLFSQ